MMDYLELLVGKVWKELKVHLDTGAQTVCLGRKVTLWTNGTSHQDSLVVSFKCKCLLWFFSVGVKGEQGLMGVPGVTGVQGERGPTGPKGNSGATGKWSFTTLTPSQHFFFLIIPSSCTPGFKGPPGNQGVAPLPPKLPRDRGPQGPQGTPGPHGIKGPIGPQGFPGDAGWLFPLILVSFFSK